MQYDELEEKIIEKIKDIYDPEIAVNIYDLGLIYSIEFEAKGEQILCLITMTLTSAGCPVSETLYESICDIGYLIEGVDNLEVFPEIVFDPPWTRDMMSDDAKLALGML